MNIRIKKQWKRNIQTAILVLLGLLVAVFLCLILLFIGCTIAEPTPQGSTTTDPVYVSTTPTPNSVNSTHLSQNFGASNNRLIVINPEPITGVILYLSGAGLTGEGTFDADIFGAPTTTNVYYDGDSDENIINGIDAYPWDGSIYWGKFVLHNTTRSNYRLVENWNLVTNLIVTESSTDNWADNDVITLQSLTNTDSGAMDIDLSDKIGANVVGAWLEVLMQDLENAYDSARWAYVHPYEDIDVGKVQYIKCNLGLEAIYVSRFIKIVDQKMTLRLRKGCDNVAIKMTVGQTYEYADN